MLNLSNMSLLLLCLIMGFIVTAVRGPCSAPKHVSLVIVAHILPLWRGF